MIKDRDDARAIRELLRSNQELRVALILAGREILKLNFGKRDTPLLNKLREIVRQSQAVAKKFQE